VTICILTIGGLWLCLARGAWRLGGLAAAPVAALLVASAAPPRFFIADDGENAGVIVETDEGRRLALAKPRRDRFAARAWMESAGIDPARAEILALRDVGACDDEGCVVVVEGVSIAVSTGAFGADDDCLRADVVIALHRMSRRAKGACAAQIVDIWRARDGQGATGAVRDGAVSIRTVADARGARPWSGGAPVSTSASGRPAGPAR
jgi:competence protein ComEC